MQQAQYGRMKVGRCVPRDLGYIGCASDVREHFDSICTGKRGCRLQVGPVDIPSTQGCIKGLERYLEASFTCVSGIIKHILFYIFHLE